jgi:hypothetical protein
MAEELTPEELVKVKELVDTKGFSPEGASIAVFARRHNSKAVELLEEAVPSWGKLKKVDATEAQRASLQKQISTLQGKADFKSIQDSLILKRQLANLGK